MRCVIIVADAAAGRPNPTRLRIDATTAHPSQASFGKTDAAQTLEVAGGYTWTISAAGLVVVDTGATLVREGAGTLLVSAAQQHGSGATLDLRDSAAWRARAGVARRRRRLGSHLQYPDQERREPLPRPLRPMSGRDLASVECPW